MFTMKGPFQREKIEENSEKSEIRERMHTQKWMRSQEKINVRTGGIGDGLPYEVRDYCWMA